MAKMSKKKQLEMLDVAREQERNRIVKYLSDEQLFTPALEPLLIYHL